jgi:hypothetical protein
LIRFKKPFVLLLLIFLLLKLQPLPIVVRHLPLLALIRLGPFSTMLTDRPDMRLFLALQMDFETLPGRILICNRDRRRDGPV